jgi:hypothetical protein
MKNNYQKNIPVIIQISYQDLIKLKRKFFESKDYME